VEGMKERKQ